MATNKKVKAEDTTFGVTGSFKRLLFDEVFVVNKTNKVREGFRRLAIIMGSFAFAWAVANIQELVDMIFIKFGTFSGSVAIVLDGFVCVFFFFTAAFATKAVGWVVEGFTGGK